MEHENSPPVYLNAAAISQETKTTPSFIARCYSDGEVVVENHISKDSYSNLFETQFHRVSFATSDNQIFLLLASGNKVYMTYFSTQFQNVNFFNTIKEITLVRESLITSMDAIVVNGVLLCTFGHYDGLVSFGRVSLNLKSWAEVDHALDKNGVINSSPNSTSSILRIKWTRGDGNDLILTLSQSSGVVSQYGMTFDGFSEKLSFSQVSTHQFTELAFDFSFFEKTLIVLGRGVIHLIVDGRKREIKVPGRPILCNLALCRDQLFVGDEHGNIMCIQGELIRFVKKLPSYTVGSGVFGSNGSQGLIFFDHTNHFYAL